MVRWGLTAGKEHIQDRWCGGGCGYIVDQHQRFDTPEAGDSPEFTIEAAYKTKDHTGRAVSPGWRYILKWREAGEQRQLRNYGYESKDLAVEAARIQAKDIARQLQPVHVETYTPEI